MGEEEKEKKEENGFWGEGANRVLVYIDDLLDENVVIEGYDRREGVYGDYISIYLNENRVVNTGSRSIMSKIQSREDLLPAEARFIKRPLPNGRRMFDVVDPDHAEGGRVIPSPRR